MSKVLCIEIGREMTKICEMDYKTKNPKVYHCIELPTPAGAVVDGYLAEDRLTGLKNSMQIALTEKKIKTKKVIFSIFSSKIITREVVLPAVRTGQIQNVIEANISEYFPIEPEDYVIAHSVLTTFSEGENAGRHRTLIFAAEKKLVRAYEALAVECGWVLENIDYAGNGIYQAARSLVKEQTGMFVKAETENTMVSIIKNGTLMLQRIVNYGVNSDSEDQEMLISSLLRIEDFYLLQSEGNKIDHIFVTGKGAEDSVFVASIGKQTNISCNRVERLQEIRLLQASQGVRVYRFVSCIGAGIAPVGLTTQIKKGKQETDYFHASMLLIILFLVLGGAIISSSVLPYLAELEKEQELKQLEETYIPAKAVYERYMALSELYEQIDYANRLTEHANDGLLQFLNELEKKLPSDVRVKEFQSDDEQAVIQMVVADKETAARVIHTLREFDSIMSLSVTDVVEESEDETKEKEVSFLINCMYVQPEITQPEESGTVATDGTAVE